MNVLSLFDGASCCMVCLKRAGIPIDTYYGADIKKAAIRCEELIVEYYGVKHVQLGDVTKIDYSQLPHIDLLCARFHTYPVEIMEQFSAPQAQSLMGDGWHCGSIQWLFDKLAELTNPQPKE